MIKVNGEELRYIVFYRLMKFVEGREIFCLVMNFIWNLFYNKNLRGLLIEKKSIKLKVKSKTDKIIENLKVRILQHYQYIV